MNAANLVNSWNTVTFTPTTTSLTITPATITHGQAANFTVSVSPTAATGDVSLAGGPSGGSLGIGPFTLGSGGTISSSTNMLPGGTYNVAAHYAGNGALGASNSAAQSITVNPENSKTLVQLVTESCGGMVYGATTVPYGYNIVCNGGLYLGYWLKVDVTNSSGALNPANSGGIAGGCISSTTGLPSYQCPTGYVAVKLNGSTFPASDDAGAPSDNTPGTYTLNSQGSAEDQYIQLPGGADTLQGTYTPHPIAPNNSYNTSTSANTTVTVTPAATTMTVSASPNPFTAGSNVTLTAVVNTTSIGNPPTGTVAFYNSSNLISGNVTLTPAGFTVTSSGVVYATLTATLSASFGTNASVTANYSGDGNYQASTSSAVAVTLSTGTADFSLAANPPSFNITSPGQSASTTVSASPSAGFTGTVSLSCALQSTMTYSTCTLTPTSFSVPGGSSILEVTTTASSTALRPFNGPSWFIPSAGALLASLLLLLIPGRKRRAKLAFGLVVFALLAAAFVACGGGSGSTPVSTPGTPTGNYTVTVTATSGKLSHSLNIPVTVQ